MKAYRGNHPGEEPLLEISERARLRELERENRELKIKCEFLPTTSSNVETRRAASSWAQTPYAGRVMKVVSPYLNACDHAHESGLRWQRRDTCPASPRVVRRASSALRPRSPRLPVPSLGYGGDSHAAIRLKHARPEGLAPAREAALNAYPKACSPATRPSLRRSGPAASPFPCTTTTGQEACWMTAALIGPLPRLSANPQLYHQSCGKGTRIQGRTWPNHIICPQILRRMPATSILWPSAPLPPWAQHPGLDGLSTTQTSPPPIAVYRATLPRAA